MTKEITLKEAQKIELDILIYLKDLCDENNLKYYLAYGTLLGAVRHKGFIPWDDDVDVFMPREDYYKLLQVMKEKPHQYYKMVSFEVNERFTAPLPKIIDTRTVLIQNYSFVERVELGVYIDIFILDGLGSNYQDALSYYKYRHEIYKKWNRADMKMFPPCSDNRGKDILRWLRNCPYKIMGIAHYLGKIQKYGEQKSFYQNKYVSQTSLPSCLSDPNNIWTQQQFGEGKELMFENVLFRCPKKYHDLLTKFYGDYMPLPPKEKQVGNHDYEAYWRE